MRSIVGFQRKLQPREVRVIGPDGSQMGILPLAEAFRRADDLGLDLVGVQPNANPPVCKVIDHGKFKYEKKKAAQEAKRTQTVVELKEIKFRPKIEQHDFEVKLKKIRKFLEDGNRVKLTVMFRGRENIHKDIGVDIINRAIVEMEDIAHREGPLKAEGRVVFTLLAPGERKKMDV